MEAIPLSQAKAGGYYKIVSVRKNGSGLLERLAAFGITKGDQLRLTQKYPAFVVKVGETVLALDLEYANAITVTSSN